MTNKSLSLAEITPLDTFVREWFGMTSFTNDFILVIGGRKGTKKQRHPVSTTNTDIYYINDNRWEKGPEMN